MVCGEEGGSEDKVDGTGAVYAVQGSLAVCVVIWELELGDNGGCAQISK